jgi:hypothetical protein
MMISWCDFSYWNFKLRRDAEDAGVTNETCFRKGSNDLSQFSCSRELWYIIWAVIGATATYSLTLPSPPSYTDHVDCESEINTSPAVCSRLSVPHGHVAWTMSTFSCHDDQAHVVLVMIVDHLRPAMRTHSKTLRKINQMEREMCNYLVSWLRSVHYTFHGNMYFIL